MIELAYRVFDLISILKFKSLLLYSINLIISSSLIFYMNDFFDDFRDFENLFYFL